MTKIFSKLLTRLGILLATALVIKITFLASLVWLVHLLNSPISSLEQPQMVEFKSGVSAKTVANQLHKAGLLDNPTQFVWYLRLNKQANLIKAGEYKIQPNWNFYLLKDALINAKVQNYGFTILPGENLKQVQAKLKNAKNLTQTLDNQAWLELAKQQNLASLEGMLLPETYFYQKGETDRQLVERAMQDLQKVLTKAWAEKAGGLQVKTPYEALILASLIEKETGVAHERHQISGVFHRRLALGMRLQTDPAVIYGMGESYQGKIGRKGLDTPTPYNTYKIKGLTPTPIAMPSKEAIFAAVQPDDSDALYFVAKGKGEHYFSSNLAEHNRAVRKYILNKDD